jgi:hypothetical protein
MAANSKSQVSWLYREMDELMQTFLRRPIEALAGNAATWTAAPQNELLSSGSLARS